MRHATETTTAIRNIGPMLLMMIFPFVAYPLVTVAITILNTPSALWSFCYSLWCGGALLRQWAPRREQRKHNFQKRHWHSSPMEK